MATSSSDDGSPKSDSPPALSDRAMNFPAEFEHFVKASRQLDEEDKSYLLRMAETIKLGMKGTAERMPVKHRSKPLLRCRAVFAPGALQP